MMNHLRISTKLFCCSFSILLLQNTNAQNTTSPYSILGIGDIETKDFGRWYGMGSTSIALSNPYYINASNPASLMALQERMMNFDMANRGKNAQFKYAAADTFTTTTKDFSIRRISLAFKPNKKWAFSVGLKPFSTINYLLSETKAYSTNSASLAKTVDGSGGLNQVYLSLAKKIGKNLSVGLTSSYYFGSANILTQYYGDDLTVSLDKQVDNVMSAFQFQAGLQYNIKSSELINHKFGLTISNPTSVKQRIETAYLSNSVSIKNTTDTKKDFKLPLSLGLGYAMVYNDNFTVSADVVFNNWQKQKMDYANSYTSPAGRASVGIEYISRKKIDRYVVENWYLQAGVNAENNYFTIQNKALTTYGFTLGFGKNISGKVSVYTGYEYGIRGNNSYGQIKEQFSQYIVGLTFKEFWYNFRKYGKFQ